MMTLLWLALLGAPSLSEAAQLLADYDPDGALVVLEAVERADGRPYAENVLLYELLGQARAYKGDRAGALAAFAELLMLDPGHIIDYGLSPQVTLLFEEARRAAQRRPTLDVQLSWPDELATRDPIALSLRARNDGDARLHRARLRASLDGRELWTSELPLGPSAPARAVVPPLAESSTTAATLVVSAELFDARGNVVRAMEGTRAWQIPLAYAPEPAWYAEWWLWALVGAAAVAGTATALVVAQPRSATVDGVVEWRR